jgi:hypothetical protein
MAMVAKTIFMKQNGNVIVAPHGARRQLKLNTKLLIMSRLAAELVA